MAWPATTIGEEDSPEGDMIRKAKAIQAEDGARLNIAAGRVDGREPGEIGQIFDSLNKALSLLEISQENLLERIQPIASSARPDDPMPATVPAQRDPSSPMGKMLEEQVQRINRLRLRQEDARERISL